MSDTTDTEPDVEPDAPPSVPASLAEFEERLVALLDEVRAAQGPALRAATTTNGFPANVAAAELIESAWGNAVANTLLAGFPAYTSVRTGSGIFPTNANGDGVVTFTPAFPTACRSFVVVDATQGIDQAFIIKVMADLTTKLGGWFRVYLHDGTKVVNNGAIRVHYIAYGN